MGSQNCRQQQYALYLADKSRRRGADLGPTTLMEVFPPRAHDSHGSFYPHESHGSVSPRLSWKCLLRFPDCLMLNFTIKMISDAESHGSVAPIILDVSPKMMITLHDD